MKYTKEVKLVLCFRWDMDWRTIEKHLQDKDSAIATHPDTQAIIKGWKKVLKKVIA